MLRFVNMPDWIDFILRFSAFVAMHSLLAVPGIKQRISNHFNRELPAYRLIYNLLSFVMFGWVMLAWQATTVLYVLPGIWSLVFHGLQGLILLGFYFCLRQTGLADFLGTNLGKNETSPQLHCSGWYGIVRHPLYFLAILFCLLNPVMTTRWIVLTLLSGCYFIWGAMLEERRLLAIFGSRYETYKRQTPFIIPRLRNIKPPG